MPGSPANKFSYTFLLRLCALGFDLFGLASLSSGVLNPDLAGPQRNQIQIIRALRQPLIMTHNDAFQVVGIAQGGEAH
ncbi:hypothetical protein K6W19_21435 [Pseudomonas protegens]|nr:hypothetical protein [Pseudomonas protegens]